MRTQLWIAALMGSLCLGGAALAEQSPAPTDLGHTPELALTVLQPKTHATLTVTSPAFKNGGVIPEDNTQYGKNIFPGLHWTAGPAGTHSYVIIIQSESYGGSPTAIQFTLYNVPAAVTALDAGMTTPPTGAVYGSNVHGAAKPYAGPHTHTGDQHGYHFQVFALDTVLQPQEPVSFGVLMSAMMGHVLVSGDLVGHTAKPEGAVYTPNKG